jgi:predicted nucleic acid-binding protein
MPFEAANIVRRTVARGVIDRSFADRALRWLTALPADVVPFDLVVRRAWHLRDNLTIYDASYVATAERLGARLLTLDRQIAAAPDVRCEVLIAPAA